MAFWLATVPLVLASRSAARRTLLEAAGIPVELCPADLDERAIEANGISHEPTAVAALLGGEKAASVAKPPPGRLHLGAGQALALGSKRFSKSLDGLATRAQLQALRSRTHELHAAIAFVQDEAVVFEHVETARLTMREFSDDFLDRYLDMVGDAVFASV